MKRKRSIGARVPGVGHARTRRLVFGAAGFWKVPGPVLVWRRVPASGQVPAHLPPDTPLEPTKDGSYRVAPFDPALVPAWVWERARRP